MDYRICGKGKKKLEKIRIISENLEMIGTQCNGEIMCVGFPFVSEALRSDSIRNYRLFIFIIV
jgi:hypothetical protein